MLVFLTTLAASNYNKLNFSEKIFNGFSVLTPTSRIGLIEEALSGEIKAIKGNKESVARLVDVFNYTVSPSQPATNGGSFKGHCNYNLQLDCGGQIEIRWAKKQPEPNRVTQENYRVQCFYQPHDGIQPCFGVDKFSRSSSGLPICKINSPECNSPFAFLPRNGGPIVHQQLKAPKQPQWVNPDSIPKRPPSGGSIMINPSIRDGKFEMTGGLQIHKGNWDIRVGGGRKDGAWVGDLTIIKTFAKSSEEPETEKALYITEVITPDGVVTYLPSYTEHKFDNLAEQLKNRKAEIARA